MIPRTRLSINHLLEGLVSYRVASPEQITAALGASYESLSLNEVELRLVNARVIAPSRLLQLKGTLTGTSIYDDPNTLVRIQLAPSVVRQTGAFVLDRAPLTVAMVEDSDQNVEAVATALGVSEFEVWLITGPQFDSLYETYYSDILDDDDVPEVADMHEILDEALRRNASDVHLGVGRPPSLRADGGLVYLPRQPLTAQWLEREIPVIMSAERFESSKETFDADAAYSYGDARFRVNIGADYMGQTVALRRIPARVPLLDDIGLPSGARSLCELERGLVLVTGPTGSGKSTTLAAMLSHIAMTKDRHIITLEDPIEFYLPSGRSVVNQREMGESFTSFPAGLRQALRQDPDVILVGELRDPETIRTALTAAETGHLVFGTLHTFDAASTVGRIVSSFPPDEQAHARAQLSYILKGIIAQTLITRVTQKGRVAAFEVMLATTAIQNNLAKVDGHNSLHQTIETSSTSGMVTMEASLADLVRRGVIREDEALYRSPDKDAFMRRLQSFNNQQI